MLLRFVCAAILVISHGLELSARPLPSDATNKTKDITADIIAVRSNSDYTHAQFPVYCPDLSTSGDYIRFNFIISRKWGLDSRNPTCILSPGVEIEEQDEPQLFPYSPDQHLSPQDATYTRPWDAGTETLPNEHFGGTTELRTILSNTTHHIKALRYTLTTALLNGHNAPLPASQQTGFTISYARRPVSKILRITQYTPSLDPFLDVQTHLEEWTNPSPSDRFFNKPYPPIDAEHVGAAFFDTYWVECGTLACRVNQSFHRWRRTYTDCLDCAGQGDREECENWDIDPEEPLGHCYVYFALARWYGKLGFVVIGLMGLVVVRRRFRRARARRWTPVEDSLFMDDEGMSWAMGHGNVLKKRAGERRRALSV